MATATTTKRKHPYFATVPAQEIVPIINGNYESSVRGIFVIGDVTGLPLVKVAANQGVEVIEKMAARGAFRNGEASEHLDLVIIGGGPAGLSAAVEAQKRDLRYVVLERGKAASTVRGFPPGKMVYAEPRFLKNESALDVEGAHEKSAFLRMIDRVIEEHGLKIREGTEVSRVVKKGEHHFAVETKDGKTFPARNVLVAVGRQGQPRLLDVPGADRAHKVTYRLHTPDDYRDKDVLIVGGGNSAIEAALMLMDHNRVTLAYRGEDFFRAKEDNRRQLEDAEQGGKLIVLRKSKVKAIRETDLDIDVDGTARTLPNDNVIILIGTLPPVDFLLDMGLELDGIWTKKRVLWSVVGLALGIFVYFFAKHFVLHPDAVDDGFILIPGLAWLFRIIPNHFNFTNLYGFYYLLYFTSIAVFGIYWGFRYKHKLIWRRNLSAIFFNWGIWWGLPTFLVVFIGANPYTPFLQRLVNAWPLNMTAFQVPDLTGPGHPAWWQTFAIVGVVWAVVLTFIVLPLFTLRFGKIYCSHVCSCGALAETVGNSFRHRGPKGDGPRRLEKVGFVFILLATVATIADLLGWKGPFGWYHVGVGTFLAGALSIGLYPFLGQRMWCRMWCPLAFWMNFWGRWSRFRITPEKGKCIDCNVCNQYCQMGIDIKSRALQGKPVTLVDTPCVGCAECVVRCPMGILHLGELPADNRTGAKTGRSPVFPVKARVRKILDIPKMNDLSLHNRGGGQ